MPRGLDWEGAAKRDYIRGHGSTPYWSDLPKPKSLQRRPEETKTGKAVAKQAHERGRRVVAEFERLKVQDRLREVESYRARIRALCVDELRALPASRKRYASAIQVAQRQLLAEIKSLARASTRKGEEGGPGPSTRLSPRAP